ncbi:hypothetical protein GPALN_011758 [Globodera pallida]|nr:hypothetical protein GPALN_011758 [Globodera pallida]
MGLIPWQPTTTIFWDQQLNLLILQPRNIRSRRQQWCLRKQKHPRNQDGKSRLSIRIWTLRNSMGTNGCVWQRHKLAADGLKTFAHLAHLRDFMQIFLRCVNLAHQIVVYNKKGFWQLVQHFV